MGSEGPQVNRYLSTSLLITILLLAACSESSPEPDPDPRVQALAPYVVSNTRGAQQGFFYTEDQVTFGLLAHQLTTGKPPTLQVVETTLQRAADGEQIPGYRLRGFRAFWSGHVTQVDWQRFPLNELNFMFTYGGYLQYKQAARINALNQFQSAIVGSEEAWRNAMDDWKRHEQANQTLEAYSDSEHDAWRAIIDSEAAIQAAEAAIQGG